MGFLKKLSAFFSAPAGGGAPVYTFAVRCARCGEILPGRVHLGNDLSLTDDGVYYCRKVLIGSGRCFQAVEVELRFDAQRRLLDRQAAGGQLVEA